MTTPKLGLPVDAAGTSLISTQPLSWDKVDLSAGVMTTLSTAPAIPNSQLYEGAIVAEKDTGISYRCTTDGSGGWIKKYINYPQSYVAWSNHSGVGNNVNTEWGWNNFNAGASVNSSAAQNMSSDGWNGFKANVKALYSIVLCSRWVANGNGLRRTALMKNHGVDQLYEQLDVPPNDGNVCGQVAKWEMPLNVNDLLTTQVQQTSGTTVACYFACHIQIIRPIP